ncbi:MAG: helix-turn-helix domain-containing protein [Sulfolobales archaeon]|nr:helix-turn-helix domain-containing protein [Sulfolobales archaeon]MCX8208936.1 helix-turn-helix domain-containing protein [Sulfolobales archaeon]MDW8010979.1 helix-turn-helix domain-containing protein [Sulfolobales archaeon]
MSVSENISGSRLAFAKFVTANSRNSFFSSLSMAIGGTLVINVLPLPSRREYIVIARPSDSLDRSTINSLSDKKEHGKIERLKVVKFGKHTYVLALKSRCEFYDIAESNNIAIVSPYTIARGTRVYYAAGSLADLAKYSDELSYYYGHKNVAMSFEKDVSKIMKDLEKAFTSTILWNLTRREIEVLRAAYSTGFLSHRRYAKMDRLVDFLGVKKPTLSIMIRKAVNKVLEELLEV